MLPTRRRFSNILIRGTFDVSGTTFQAAVHIQHIRVASLYLYPPPANHWTFNVVTNSRARLRHLPIKRIDRLSDILEVKRVIAGGVALTY